MTHLRLVGPHDGPVAPVPGHQQSYRAPAGPYVVTLPRLARLADGVQLAVQRSARDTGTGLITVSAAGDDTFSDGQISVALVNPGDLYLLETMTVSGARSWLVVDIQTAGRPITTVTDSGDGTGLLG